MSIAVGFSHHPHSRWFTIQLKNTPKSTFWRIFYFIKFIYKLTKKQLTIHKNYYFSIMKSEISPTLILPDILLPLKSILNS